MTGSGQVKQGVEKTPWFFAMVLHLDDKSRRFFDKYCMARPTYDSHRGDRKMIRNIRGFMLGGEELNSGLATFGVKNGC
jgi:hypothetical protein